MDDIAVIVGTRIKELRSRRKWTQEQLAEYADLHVSYVIALEKGRKNASLEVLYRIACAFEMSLSDFFDIPKVPIRTSPEQQYEERIEALVHEFSKKLIKEIKQKNIADQ